MGHDDQRASAPQSVSVASLVISDPRTERTDKSGKLMEKLFTEAGHKVTQLLTGVRAQYRGRGLGKLLKALMLLHVRAAYPEVKYISTGNADSNAPMLAINRKLGFRKHRQVKIYKLKISKGVI